MKEEKEVQQLSLVFGMKKLNLGYSNSKNLKKKIEDQQYLYERTQLRRIII